MTEDFATRMARIAKLRAKAAFAIADAAQAAHSADPTPERGRALRRAIERAIYANAWEGEWVIREREAA